MSSALLPMILLNAEWDIEQALPRLVSGQVDLARVLATCRSFRWKGICSLFLEGLAQPFYIELHRSGTALAAFLKHVTDDQKITSKADPLFDAIGCGDFATAQSISQHARLNWNSDWEYEDDFLYVLFLMNRFFLKSTDDECRDIVQRYKRVLNGAYDFRFDVCNAFMELDSDTFNDALLGLIDEREAYYQEAFDRDEILEDEWATDGKCFVEGLAMVRLARVLKLDTLDEYLFIPSTVTAGTCTNPSPDSWQTPFN